MTLLSRPDENFDARSNFSHSASLATTPSNRPIGPPATRWSRTVQWTASKCAAMERSRYHILLLLSRALFPFVNVCIAISMMAFQSSWGVGVSGFSVVAFLVNLVALLHGGSTIIAAFFAHKSAFLARTDHTFRQARIAVVLCGIQVFITLVMVHVTTISANVSGCKNPYNDPHASLPNYLEALPHFCQNKRGLAVFTWFSLIAWTLSLLITVSSLMAQQGGSQEVDEVSVSTEATTTMGRRDEEATIATTNSSSSPPSASFGERREPVKESNSSADMYGRGELPAYRSGEEQNPFGDRYEEKK